MLCNSRYGRIGMVAMPYYVLFEFLAPVIELAGMVMVPLGFLVGVIAVEFALRFLLVAYGYARVVNIIALAVEEFTFARYPRWKDLAYATVAQRPGERRLPPVDRPLAGAGRVGRDQEESPGVGCDDAHRLP